MPKKHVDRDAPREKRVKTAEQAFQSLMALCAKAERSSGDARRLMYRWGVAAVEQQAVIDRLIKDRFIDDTRYAEAFVREKLRFSGWGAFKIRATLTGKGIDRQIIEQALAQLNKESMQERLVELLTKKSRTIKAANDYDRRAKLIRYGLSLGYDYDAVGDAVDRLASVDSNVCE